MSKLSTFIVRIAARVLVRLINNDKTVAEAVAELIDNNRPVQKAIRDYLMNDNKIDNYFENIASNAVDTDSFLTQRDLQDEGYVEQRELEELTEQVAELATEASEATAEARELHDEVDALRAELAAVRKQLEEKHGVLDVVRLIVYKNVEGFKSIQASYEADSKATIVAERADLMNSAWCYSWETFKRDENDEVVPFSTTSIEYHTNERDAEPATFFFDEFSNN